MRLTVEQQPIPKLWMKEPKTREQTIPNVCLPVFKKQRLNGLARKCDKLNQ